MSQQQEPTNKKDKYSGVYVFLLFPALFILLYLFGSIDPPSDFIDGFYIYITRMLIAAVICMFAWAISLYIFERFSGKVQLWITIAIVLMVGVLYASGALPNQLQMEKYYEGYGSGYSDGYHDAAGFSRSAFNAGIEAEQMIIHDPEDYTAEGLFEEWQEDNEFWHFDELSGRALYNIHHLRQQK